MTMLMMDAMRAINSDAQAPVASGKATGDSKEKDISHVLNIVSSSGTKDAASLRQQLHHFRSKTLRTACNRLSIRVRKETRDNKQALIEYLCTYSATAPAEGVALLSAAAAASEPAKTKIEGKPAMKTGRSWPISLTPPSDPSTDCDNVVSPSPPKRLEIVRDQKPAKRRKTELSLPKATVVSISPPAAFVQDPPKYLPQERSARTTFQFGARAVDVQAPVGVERSLPTTAMDRDAAAPSGNASSHSPECKAIDVLHAELAKAHDLIEQLHRFKMDLLARGSQRDDPHLLREIDADLVLYKKLKRNLQHKWLETSMASTTTV